MRTLDPTTETNLVDARVGMAVAVLRRERGLAFHAAARSAGLTSEDVTQVEQGGRRLSADEMFTLCNELDVPVGFFLREAEASTLPRVRGLSAQKLRTLGWTVINTQRDAEALNES